MTNDELKKYREQIEKLKKDFHKDNPQNIEKSNLSFEPNKVSEKLEKPKNEKKISFLESIKNAGINTEVKKAKTNEKINQETENKIANEKNKSILTENETQKKEVEQTNNPFEIEKKVIKKTEIIPENKPTESTKITSKKVNVEKKITPIFEFQNNDIKPLISEKKEITKPIEKPKPEVTKTQENANKSNIITPKVSKDIITDESKEDKKSSIFKFIIAIILILLIGFGVYYFINKNNKKQILIAEKKAEEKEIAFSDSVLAYEMALENDISEQIQKDFIKISDTIFNIISNQDEAYYAILGSFSELKNAKKLQRNQKTNFEAVVFNQNPIRVGLKLNELTVLEDLEIVKELYPAAWLIYNKN
ncbi:MAG: hypothetical protein ACPG4Y_08605 [Chitinophagales bacterium]